MQFQSEWGQERRVEIILEYYYAKKMNLSYFPWIQAIAALTLLRQSPFSQGTLLADSLTLCILHIITEKIEQCYS